MSTSPGRAPVLTAEELGIRGPLGGRATLVQFSSNFCAPCRSTRGLLAWVAGKEPGVRHVELEITRHLELGEALGVTRTPTFFLLDPDGAVLARQEDAPRLAGVRELLDRLVPARG
ncbi:TlpA family protein disulfide reductase [Georgenia sp. Z1491]|uniref:TlpA family protein disulfide reductase n=1 Tax=Georgenia sp. Z1491 TaxID=3416707 RepID=UPI003CE7ED34